MVREVYPRNVARIEVQRKSGIALPAFPLRSNAGYVLCVARAHDGSRRRLL